MTWRTDLRVTTCLATDRDWCRVKISKECSRQKYVNITDKKS